VPTTISSSRQNEGKRFGEASIFAANDCEEIELDGEKKRRLSENRRKPIAKNAEVKHPRYTLSRHARPTRIRSGTDAQPIRSQSKINATKYFLVENQSLKSRRK
jgi:hypothetical protein